MVKKEIANVIVNTELVDVKVTDDGALDKIKNKDLKKALASYLSSAKKGFDAAWSAVESINKASKNLKDDFNSQKEFAEFVGLQESEVSRMINVMSYEGTVDFKSRGYTPQKAYLLLPFKDEKLINDIIDNVPECGADMSYESIRLAAKEYKDMAKLEKKDGNDITFDNIRGRLEQELEEPDDTEQDDPGDTAPEDINDTESEESIYEHLSSVSDDEDIYTYTLTLIDEEGFTIEANISNMRGYNTYEWAMGKLRSALKEIKTAGFDVDFRRV